MGILMKRLSLGQSSGQEGGQPASLAQTQESQSSDIKHDHDLFTAN